MSKESPYFDPEWFNLSFDAILQDAVNQVGNVGQGVIILQASNPVKQILMNLGNLGGRRKVNKSTVIAAFRVVMGEEKYKAVSIIVETAAENLIIAMDDSTGGDGKNQKLFHSMEPFSYIQNLPSPASLIAYAKLGFISGKI